MAQVTMEQAERLIKANVTEQHLFTHARAVSAAMGAMAERCGADKAHWEAVGYLSRCGLRKVSRRASCAYAGAA